MLIYEKGRPTKHPTLTSSDLGHLLESRIVCKFKILSDSLSCL